MACGTFLEQSTAIVTAAQYQSCAKTHGRVPSSTRIEMSQLPPALLVQSVVGVYGTVPENRFSNDIQSQPSGTRHNSLETLMPHF